MNTYIRNAISDQTLQSALDSNSEKRITARAAALESLPDWRERRQRAHAMRADVIEHLDAYLAQFIEQVQTNGITVHRAKTAADANRIVLEIIATSQTQRTQKNTTENPVAEENLVSRRGEQVLIAKSKSMVSEEIALNHALEAAGHRVVETDLGEYIIQLRGERPSHIITPAAHLRRHHVAQLFHEKLGIPYTEDIPTLTQTARKVLRDVFLNADIGISGVNFGVAESGTLTLVTNEGNGRMVTTLPLVHIALMGMERLVPTLADLALMLSLLPRHATGQKLSVYTQLIHQPEPGQQRHLVIVDNGRAALRQSPLRESLYCIRCGACLNACPVFRELGGHAYRGKDGEIAPYPGPIGSVISPGLMGENYVHLAQASTLCGACKEACPVDIDLPKMLLRIRAGEMPEAQKSAQKTQQDGLGLPAALKFGLKLYSRLAAHPRWFAILQKIAGWFASPLPAHLPTPAWTGWGYSKDFPKPAARPFRERFSSLPVDLSSDSPVNQPDNRTTEQPEHRATTFTAELTALNGQVIATNAQNLAGEIAAFLHGRGVKSLQVDESLLPRGLTDSLSEGGISIQREHSDGCEAGLTGALAGIAQSGSILLTGNLTVSLVPPVHLAILRVVNVMETLEEALALPEIARAKAVSVVTGPSRTADIEMTLTLGVHGPGEVIVFLVGD
jgi:L-lactate dehydrogenase complex protein LldF